MTRVDPSVAEDTVVRTDDGAPLAVTTLAPLAHDRGNTVVLVHGWGAGGRVWGTVADRLLRDGFRVVRYDQRGHGASGLGGEPIGIERLGKDLGAVLAAVTTPETVVVGHSGGGFAALAYAVSDPVLITARLRGLVLLSTAAHGQRTPDSEVRMMGSGAFSWALRRPVLGRRLLRHTLGKYPDSRTLEVHRQMFAATPASVRAACFGATREMDLREGLAALRLPAEVVVGAADRVVDPALGRSLADRLPDAGFRSVPGTGHQLPLEAPDAVVQAITDLLARSPLGC